MSVVLGLGWASHQGVTVFVEDVEDVGCVADSVVVSVGAVIVAPVVTDSVAVPVMRRLSQIIGFAFATVKLNLVV